MPTLEGRKHVEISRTTQVCMQLQLAKQKYSRVLRPTRKAFAKWTTRFIAWKHGLLIINHFGTIYFVTLSLGCFLIRTLSKLVTLTPWNKKGNTARTVLHFSDPFLPSPYIKKKPIKTHTNKKHKQSKNPTNTQQKYAQRLHWKKSKFWSYSAHEQSKTGGICLAQCPKCFNTSFSTGKPILAL